MFTKSEELAIHNQIISNEIKNQLKILKHKLTIKFDSYKVVPNLEIGKEFDKKLGSLDYRIKLDSYNVYYKGALLGAEFSDILGGIDEAKQLVEERFGTTNKVVNYQAALNEFNEEIEEIKYDKVIETFVKYHGKKIKI